MFLDFLVVFFCIGVIFCVIYAIYNVKKLRFLARQQQTLPKEQKQKMFVYNPPPEDEVDVFASIEEE